MLRHFAVLLLGTLSMGAMASENLGAGAERFAGTPVRIDPRLATRSCPPDGFRFQWAGQAVEARCEASGERLLLPLAVGSEQVRLKRGDSVQADYVGSGFRVSVGAVADAAGRDGRVTLRNSRSGQQFAARMDETGRISVSEPGE